MRNMAKTKINIFSENIHKEKEVDEKKAIAFAKKVLNYYIYSENIFDKSCLKNYDFSCISFDILYCDSGKTHDINKEYRQKDYPADIITFAIFADSEDKFIFDEEINLGEIIISLDKVSENALEKSTSDIDELYFLITHGIMHLLGFDHQTIEEYNFIIEAQTSAIRDINKKR